MDPLITVAEADARIRAAAPDFGTENVPLELAIGRTLIAPIRADRPLPPYPRAMMDGIAFPSTTAPPFKIQGLHAAGDPPPAPLKPGHAWEIMTGAIVPDDCDTIVPYEDLTAENTTPTAAIHPGEYIHPAGADAARDEILVPAGSPLGPAEIAIAASVGLDTLQVACRPRIALLTTGDEAVPPGQSPEPWQIRQSNGPTLAAILHRLGYPPKIHQHLPDDPEAISRTLDQVLPAVDFVILTGGISRGKKDHLRALIAGRLGDPAFHGVLQKPGKPLAFWPGPPTVFALPGNPVSVLATFTRYVLPLISPRPLFSIELHTSSLPKLTWLLPVKLTPDGPTPLPPTNSGNFVSIAGATGFAEIPPASTATRFTYHPFP